MPRCTRVHVGPGQERERRFCRLDDPGRARTPSSELQSVPAMAEDGDEQVAQS